MKKTIKIIDLLNKIANGKELPKRIIWDKNEFLCGKNNIYNDKNDEPLIYNLLPSGGNLNDEVEIIEEEKKIEKLSCIETGMTSKAPSPFEIMEKINELIDIVNELKKGE